MKQIENRIAFLRKKHNLSQQELADRLGCLILTVGKLERGQQSLTVDWIERIGEALGESPLAIISPVGEAIETVSVIGYAQSGDWRGELFWPDEDSYSIVIPRLASWENYTKKAFEVRGNSMDEIYPNGSIVAWVPFEEAFEPISQGKFYLIERVRGKLREISVKEYHVDAYGSHWFVPRTKDMAERMPIKAQPEAGEFIRVVGRVVWASRVEEGRSPLS